MRIPDSAIDDVRSATDIIDVISAFVPLKKRGKNYVGLCPFHQEKTPSFTVSSERQMYHCFGCGAGGNVFTFVMEHDRVSFVEAVRTLAARAGISLPEEGTDRAETSETEALYDACKRAGRHFYDNLTTTVDGKLALEYFHHRGFTDETIRLFGLGYSMNFWDDLVRLAEREHLDIRVMERAGLVLKREETTAGGPAGTYYDRFRGRAMFPIFSASGRTIGFGARKLREDDPLGKYINSPETPIYVKSRVLYGLAQAREEIRARDNAILVEGYADLLSVYQAGVKNVVASSGTALTDEQIRLIGRYAKAITLVYDADSAGSKAMVRGADLIIENGLDVRIVELPQGEDPDSFVRGQGGEAFSALVTNAVSFLDFRARIFRAEGLFETPEGKTKAVRSLVETIARMKDELKRNFYIKEVAEKYDIYESVLFRELERLLGDRSRRSAIEQTAVRRAAPEAPPIVPGSDETPVPAGERDLLKAMLEQGPSMVTFVFSRVSPDAFTHGRARAIVDLLQGHVQRGDAWDANSIINELEAQPLKRLVSDLVFSKYEISRGWAEIGSLPPEPDPQAIVERSIVRLRLLQIDRQLREEFRRMKQAEGRGEPTADHQQRILALQQEKREVSSSRSTDSPQ